jgi:hypothetical protein
MKGHQVDGQQGAGASPSHSTMNQQTLKKISKFEIFRKP